MRIYVSGPIGGYVDGNVAAFAVAAAELQARGFESVNPHDVSADHGGPCAQGKPASIAGSEHTYGCYLLQDIVVLAQCDGLYALRNWRLSPGARAEVAFAEALGLDISFEEEK